MRPLAACAVALTPVLAVQHSVYFEDLHAFPKYSVQFLNGLPIANRTAFRWLAAGLSRGLDQFLEHDADSGDAASNTPALASPEDADHESLHLMRMSRDKAFLCFTPRPPPIPPPFADDTQDITPASKSWKQLSALSGSCLYHRQGWFTYSYCHNLHVRQFREVAHSQPQPGLQVPEEDQKWESFTLGRSQTAELDNGLMDIEGSALAQNVQVARGARQRYLVQKWGDGTPCDKTGRNREIEIQETSTCKYVLVIHTPRLCGEPGFKSRVEQTTDAPIRCREILDTVPKAEKFLAGSPYPRGHTVDYLDTAKQTTEGSPSKSKPKKVADDDKISFLKKLIEGMVLRGTREADVQLVAVDGDDHQVWVVDGDKELAKLVDDVQGSKANPNEKHEQGQDQDQERTPHGDEL